MAEYLSEVVSKRDNPTIKLYDYNLKGLKDIDVDDKLCLHIDVVAKSKYHEEYQEGEPLCITFEVKKVRVDE